MDIEENLKQTTPPKRVTFEVHPPSTPPPKENPQTVPKILKSLVKSSGKKKVETKVTGFGEMTPKSNRSRMSRNAMDSQDDDQPSRLQQDYEFICNLGRGNFSSVGLYMSKVQGQKFAIKQNKRSSMSVNEIQALATLSIVAEKCPNIIRYYHSWVQKQYIFMVMEYCQTSLSKQYALHRQSGNPIPENDIIKIGKEAINALKYLHENNMVHLDLKPQNLLYSDTKLKLADLGLCRLARVKKWMELEQGDSRYLARQILNYNSSTDLTKADIFSLGMTLYEGMSLTQLPNNGDKWHELRDNYKLTNQQYLQKLYSHKLLSLVERMISQDPVQRPMAREIFTQLRELQKNDKKQFLFKNSPKRNTAVRERSL